MVQPLCQNEYSSWSGPRPPNPIMVMSVPGSGTRFVARRLLKGLDHGSYHCGWKARRRGESMVRLVRQWLDQDKHVVVPVRDPMRTLISNANHNRPVVPQDFHEYTRWRDHPSFLFFRVDCPPGQRAQEIRRLSEHVGQEISDADWSIDGAWPAEDVTGLRAAYDAGPPWTAEQLAEWTLTLCEDSVLVDFYRDLDLSYPWMEGA